uniref:Putative glycosyltransferase n=1 Tax=viral metagenome TaxID=1070528 RepID=A0A6M3L9A1_9ZZZZ
MKAKIAYLEPTYGNIDPRVKRSHLNAVLTAAKHDLWITHVGGTDQELICHARNRLAEAFLNSDCTHAFFVDSDIVLPHWAIVQLMEIDQDISSGIYFQKLDPPNLPVIYTKKGFSSWKPSEKYLHHFIVDWEEGCYFPIDACGFGCVLIKREVFERIKSPWFEFTEKGGEDIRFCVRAKQKGFQIFAHSGVMCGHIGPNGEKTYEDFKKYKDKLPVTRVTYDPALGKKTVIRNDFVKVQGE